MCLSIFSQRIMCTVFKNELDHLEIIKQIFISNRSDPAKMMRTGSGPVSRNSDRNVSGHNISFSKPLILHSPAEDGLHKFLNGRHQ
jgi:hypothetical protein